MLQAKTGFSNNASSLEAGREAAALLSGLSNPKLAFVYSSVAHDQTELLAAISQGLPGVPLIGNTSFTGIITNAGYCGGDDSFVGIMALGSDSDDLCIGTALQAKEGDARATGHKLAVAAMQGAGKDVAPDFFYMVAPPGEEEYYLKGISEVIGRVPFFGGSAADNAIAGEWLLFSDKTVCADGAGVAFFYTDQPFTNLFTGAYEESGNVGIITKLGGDRVLAEIDGVPAVKKYAEWTNQNPDDLMGMNLLVATICAPLGIKDRLGDLTAIRHPMNGNDDYSMNIGANLALNTAVIQMQTTVDELIASAGATIAQLFAKVGHKPQLMHLVHCGGRLAGIGERRDELVKVIQAAAGDVPFIVEFTFGEYGYEDDGNNTTGGLMLSFSALG